MKKRLLALLICTTLILSMTLSGCSNDGGDKKIINIVSGGQPGSLHPGLAQGTHESIILDHVFEGLMTRDADGNVVKGMASDYTVSDDKLTYTFKIKKGVKWSNGDDITAEDFEYAWKFALNPKAASTYAYQLYYLVGAVELNGYDLENGSEEELQTLLDAVGVNAIDENTLEVQLAQPTPFFLELCAFYTYYPVNKKVAEENPDWANEGTTHISNGPFKIVEWNYDDSVVLEKNNEYYNKDLVKIDGIKFFLLEDANTEWQMYQNGELDICYNLPTEVLGSLTEKNDPELYTEAELATYFYRFNVTEKPFNNVKVRKALSMSIDRASIIKEVAQGGQFPAYGIVPGGIPDFEGDFRENGGEYFTENIEEAKALLAEGLAEEGMDSLEFVILYNTDEGHKKIAEAIQEQWHQMGAEITLENTEFRVKIDREHALDYQVARAGWIGDYVDPNTFLDMFTSWSTMNDTGWTNDRYDELITLAGNEFDEETRMEYFHEAEGLLMNDLPIMPIYYYTKSRAVKPYVVGSYKVLNRDICLIYADLLKEEE